MGKCFKTNQLHFCQKLIASNQSINSGTCNIAFAYFGYFLFIVMWHYYFPFLVLDRGQAWRKYHVNGPVGCLSLFNLESLTALEN